jgi:hypothetical protein
MEFTVVLLRLNLYCRLPALQILWWSRLDNVNFQAKEKYNLAYWLQCSTREYMIIQ